MPNNKLGTSGHQLVFCKPHLLYTASCVGWGNSSRILSTLGSRMRMHKDSEQVVPLPRFVLGETVSLMKHRSPNRQRSHAEALGTSKAS